jgi:hypothetical protein
MRMKLSKEQREAIRMMFGGRCAYCGCELNGKWHVDHVEAVHRIGSYEKAEPGDRFSRLEYKMRGKRLHPENDHKDNLFPACIRCNILKSATNVEGFRSMLTYFAHSIPTIRTYSHVHHLMRFGKLHIDASPVEFWFEKYLRGVIRVEVA